MFASGPAFATEFSFIVTTAISDTGAAHGAIGCAVSVKETLPATISAALGVYVGCRVVAFVNVPDEPELVHNIVV